MNVCMYVCRYVCIYDALYVSTHICIILTLHYIPGYIFIAAIIGTLAVTALAAIPIESASLAAIFFAAANFETSVGDLLHEGKYAELMQVCVCVLMH